MSQILTLFWCQQIFHNKASFLYFDLRRCGNLIQSFFYPFQKESILLLKQSPPSLFISLSINIHHSSVVEYADWLLKSMFTSQGLCNQYITHDLKDVLEEGGDPPINGQAS